MNKDSILRSASKFTRFSFAQDFHFNMATYSKFSIVTSPDINDNLFYIVTNREAHFLEKNNGFAILS